MREYYLNLTEGVLGQEWNGESGHKEDKEGIHGGAGGRLIYDVQNQTHFLMKSEEEKTKVRRKPSIGRMGGGKGGG